MTSLAQLRARGAGKAAGRAARWLAGAAAVLATLVLAAAAPAAGTTYVDGISDQNVPYWNGDVWGGGPPASPFARYLATTLVTGSPQPLRYARYVVAYDVMCDTGGPALRLYATTEKKGETPSDSPFAKLLELKLGAKK